MLLNDFYTIMSSSQEGPKYIAEIELNPQHTIYKGHFEGNPVVPGVCMMTMVQETLAKAVGKTIILTDAKTVKFLGVVNPNENPKLTVESEITEQTNGVIKAKCSIYTDQQVFYKGSCAFHVTE